MFNFIGDLNFQKVLENLKKVFGTKADNSEVTELKENLTQLEIDAVTSKSPIPYTPSIPRDADTLGGIAASEYMRNMYSDEEVKIGKWFGQDLYRKTYIYNGVQLSTSQDTILDNNFLSSSNVLSLKVALVNVEFFVENSFYASVFIDRQSLILHQTFTNQLSNVCVIVEYVK